MTILREVVQSSALKVDRENGVIRDVRVLGPTSRNGREYSPQAIAGAIKLYEGSVVNFDHPHRSTPTAERTVADRAGWLENVRPGNGGLDADLHFLKADERADKLCEAAERRPELFGLSHNVEAKSRRRGGTILVEEITRVRSVDIVSDPATTRSLFESLEQEEASAMTVTVKEFLESLDKDNPKAQMLREVIDAGLLAEDDTLEDEVGQKVKAIVEAKEEKKEEKKEEIGAELIESKDTELGKQMAQLLEGQTAMQKEITDLKGRVGIQKPKGGMLIKESQEENGEKSTDAKDFCFRIRA